MVLSGEVVEKDAVIEVAKLMLISAKTAPKGKGVDAILTSIVVADEGDLERLAEQIESVGRRTGREGAFKDAASVRKAQAIVLIGLKTNAKTAGINCGACGFRTCAEMEKTQKVHGEFDGPICAIRLLDLGISLGSAVKTASDLNVDNRIMANIGIAAKQLKMMDADIIQGIPLSVSSKNIFFDRK